MMMVMMVTIMAMIVEPEEIRKYADKLKNGRILV